MTGCNNVGASPYSRLRGDPLACFDRLPQEVRAALWDAVVDWDPLAVRRYLNSYTKSGMSKADAIQEAVGIIRLSDQIEVQQFSYCWPERFGPYPAVAAKVSILRYSREAL